MYQLRHLLSQKAIMISEVKMGNNGLIGPEPDFGPVCC